MPVLYLGEDWTIPVQALINGAPPPGGVIGCTVLAGLVHPTSELLLVGPVTVDLGHPLGNPSVGLVVPVFTAAAIAAGAVLPGSLLLEVVIDGQTWQRAPLRIMRGAIP